MAFHRGSRCALLLILAFPGTLGVAQQRGGQRTEGTIVGQLRVGTGNFPPAHIEVKLEVRGMVAAVAYSDSEGRFSFSELTTNLYHLVVNDPAYLPVRLDAVITGFSPQSVLVQIILVPLEKKNEAGAPEQVSGGNPYLVDLKEYKKNYPKDALKAFERGLRAEEGGKTAESIKDFQKAIAIAPTFFPAHNNLGSAYLGHGDFNAAAAQFQEVIKLRPNDAAAYFNLGNVYLLTKRYPEAQTTVQDGLKKQPASGLGRFLLGTVYARTGKPHEAERMLNDALSADPTMSKVYLELVNLYLQQRMKPQAIAELKAFLSQFPQDPMAPNARAVLERLQSPSKAVVTSHQ